MIKNSSPAPSPIRINIIKRAVRLLLENDGTPHAYQAEAIHIREREGTFYHIGPLIDSVDAAADGAPCVAALTDRPRNE
jgi:hypothetical protein